MEKSLVIHQVGLNLGMKDFSIGTFLFRNDGKCVSKWNLRKKLANLVKIIEELKYICSNFFKTQ